MVTAYSGLEASRPGATIQELLTGDSSSRVLVFLVVTEGGQVCYRGLFQEPVLKFYFFLIGG